MKYHNIRIGNNILLCKKNILMLSKTHSSSITTYDIYDMCSKIYILFTHDWWMNGIDHHKILWRQWQTMVCDHKYKVICTYRERIA